jgi:RNA polymerase sigma-70 factor (ECF subfamily)
MPRRSAIGGSQVAPTPTTGWTDDFAVGIGANMPALRRYARRLRGNCAGAEDLVQDCMLCALTMWPRFQPGTNLRDWLFTVMHGIHVNQQHIRASETPLAADEADAAPDARLAFRDFVRDLATLSAQG